VRFKCRVFSLFSRFPRILGGGEEFIKEPKSSRRQLFSLFLERERGKEEGKKEREKGKTDNARTESERVLSERQKEREGEREF